MSRIDETALGQKVRAFSASNRADTHGRGTVVAYTNAPTVTIEKPSGQRFVWRADLCEIAKPDEPLGVGAVVELSDGELWVRTPPCVGSEAVWTDQHGDYRGWATLPAVRVLSEGVTP